VKNVLSRRSLVVLAIVAIVAAASGAALRVSLRAHSGTVGVRHLEPDAKSGKVGANSRAIASESMPGAVQAAAEAYDARAYPATDIAPELMTNARTSWTTALGRGHAKGKNKPGVWTLAGPSNSSQPSLLNFSGKQYDTAGRVTALAIDPNCNMGHCTLWLGAAGGGVWRTDKALHNNPNWTYVGNGLPTNAIGTLTYDASTGTLYAGTGEPNAAVDNEAGLGLFKSTDGGDHWTHLAAVTTTAVSGAYTGDAFFNRSINSVVIDPRDSNTIYVGTSSAVRGVSSVLSGGVGGPPAPLPTRGVFKSTDGGATFTLLNNQTVVGGLPAPPPGGLPVPLRGVTNVVLDPTDPDTIYVGQYQQGIWRSNDAGATWTQIFAPLRTFAQNASATERDSFAVTTLPNGNTRMYVGAGDHGIFLAKVFRSNDVSTGTPSFTDLTTLQNEGYCGAVLGQAQCWYDNVVYTPAGHPDTVYFGGSYDYSHSGVPALGGDHGARNNGRAFIVSNDGGLTYEDLTRDAGPSGSQDGMHPDQHAIVASPSNPNIVFFGSDGGLVRTSGSFADISSQCDARGLSPTDLAVCKQLLSAVPTQIESMNRNLPTLQFQSLSVNPQDASSLQGGTQDNGTWIGTAGSQLWNQTIWGDGGQSGFNAANPNLRFNTFTGQANDGNFRGGDPSAWVVISGDILSSPEGAQFYPPVTADPNPATAGSIFQGSQSIWRTQDWGGDQAFLESHCSEFTANAADPNCGDFVRIGPAGSTTTSGVTSQNTDLTGVTYGTTRFGGNVAAIERAGTDTGTLWAATTTGRLFVSQNANAADPSAVSFTRIDTLAANDPNRFISGIFIDPANANHAWVSYSGFNATTAPLVGHVFSVTFVPAVGTTPATATWTSLDGSGATAFPDIPATDVVRDTNGDLYVSNDFGVMLLPSGSTDWQVAGDGLPTVEVAGLTIVPGARKLYAATHGLSAWQMTLP
jgi:hypothetical protein